MKLGWLDCGCVVIMDSNEKDCIVLKRCDDAEVDEGEPIFWYTTKESVGAQKKFEPFDSQKSGEWIRLIQDHLYYGRLYKEIRRCISVPVREKEDYRLF